MRCIRTAIVSSLLLLALLLTGAPPCQAVNSCGLKPIKPVPPVGCRDLVAVCVCDSQGRNCHWEWHCVQ